MEFDPKEIIRREIILNKERTLVLEKINRENEINELENKLVEIKQKIRLCNEEYSRVDADRYKATFSQEEAEKLIKQSEDLYTELRKIESRLKEINLP